MNHSSENPQQSTDIAAAKQLPPVLARVPWLAGPIESPAETQQKQAKLLEPYSMVASLQTGVAHCGDYAPKYRFDPPQAGVASLEAHRSPVASEADETVVSAPQPSIERPDPSPARTATMSGPSKSVDLRFDPPATSPTTASPAEPKATKLAAGEPLPWHRTVAAADNLLRKYSRVIVVIALASAAGLLLLVLEGRTGPTEPLPDTPPTANDRVASQPELLDLSGIPPLKIDEQDQPLVARETMARGPQSHSRGRLQAPPSNADPLPLITEAPLEPLAPHREPLATEIAPPPSNRILPEDAGGSNTEGPRLQMSNYPSTGEPQASWPRFEPEPVAEQFHPPVARLSRELQPVAPERR